MLRASSGKHARLLGFVLPAVTPFRRLNFFGGILFGKSVFQPPVNSLGLASLLPQKRNLRPSKNVFIEESAARMKAQHRSKPLHATSCSVVRRLFDRSFEGVCLVLRASSRKHARLSGFVLRAVTPFPGNPRISSRTASHQGK